MLYIILAVLVSGVLSLTIAAAVSFSLFSKMIERMISLSVGVMLSTSLLHALPEAFELLDDPSSLFITLLIGLLGFFLIEKLSILCHSYYYHRDVNRDVNQDVNQQELHEHKRLPGSTGWMIMIGDGFHNFTDGILIAAAFLADPYLGVMTSIAIFAHEVPQEVGDFIILLNSGFSRTRAYLYNLGCSLLAIVGGLVGYYTLAYAKPLIPYVLTLASAGFIYIAVSDLIPQMQNRTSVRETMIQIILIGLGVGIIFLITCALHPGH